MSYALHLWALPKDYSFPTSMDDVFKIMDELEDEIIHHNRFKSFAEDIVKIFPDTFLTDCHLDNSVWAESPIDGDCNEGVYGIGIKSEFIDKIIPDLIVIAFKHGLCVTDQQFGICWLSNGIFLAIGEEPTDTTLRPEGQKLNDALKVTDVLNQDIDLSNTKMYRIVWWGSFFLILLCLVSIASEHIYIQLFDGNYNSITAKTISLFQFIIQAPTYIYIRKLLEIRKKLNLFLIFLIFIEVLPINLPWLDIIISFFFIMVLCLFLFTRLTKTWCGTASQPHK